MDQQFRGWIYIIENQAMPGLVKIGFSRKDPILRAAELDGTGMPYPYTVIYDALVEDPYNVEKSIHLHFKDKQENKEWFKCTAKYAISEIKATFKNKILLEKIYNSDFAVLSQNTESTLEFDYDNNHPPNECAAYGCKLLPDAKYKGVWFCARHFRIMRNFEDD